MSGIIRKIMDHVLKAALLCCEIFKALLPNFEVTFPNFKVMFLIFRLFCQDFEVMCQIFRFCH